MIAFMLSSPMETLSEQGPVKFDLKCQLQYDH